MKKINQLTFVFILLLLLLGGFAYSIPGKARDWQNQQATYVDQSRPTILTIGGAKHELLLTQESTVYDLMEKLRDQGKINFTYKNYAGLGKLITSINGTASNNQKTWIYYVNGKQASVGVSNYKIKPGDNVSWKYEKLLSY